MRTALSLLAASLLAACGSGGGSGEDAGHEAFVVEPSEDQVVTLILGETPPTITYEAFYDGDAVEATWIMDSGAIASVDSGPASTSIFRPTGGSGGTATITATYQGNTLRRHVIVNLKLGQNGAGTSPEEEAQIAGSVDDLTAGGGVGGVGGEGLGTEVTDNDVLSALNSPTETGSDQGLVFLYPYDGTVWPLDLPAPLLQWDWSLGDAQAIRIEMSTKSGSFDYEGIFGPPAILAETGGDFIRHPIPQNAWNFATQSASSNASPDPLTVRLTVAVDGVAYGPIEQTYTIAPARLAGTIYYQSYGTNLAKNYTGAVGGDGTFGGAVLSIKVGDTAPQLAAGSDGDATNCRVCHSVAADGSRLVAQTSEPTATYGFAITPSAIVETALTTDTSFPGLSPDGAFALTGGGQLLDLASAGSTVTTTGLEGIGGMGTPMFSPSGDRVAFNPMSGSDVDHPKQSLAVMSFNASTKAFTDYVEVVDTSTLGAEMRPGWPAFLPDGNSLVYQMQTVAGLDKNNHGDLRTRKGAKAYLAWTGAGGTGTPTPLERANGHGHIPKLDAPVNLTCTADDDPVGGIDADHANDIDLNYEPTVNPVASGGYAWMVFTSRRMYGSVADIPPFCSDPRGVDLIDNITPKKLWVAAVDLNPEDGTDPSYPAFYLPAQELLAGNARGFWVLDPCRSNGDSCDTGDQCCGGFCNGGDDVGASAVCGEDPSGGCSQTQDACDVSEDCCNSSDQCINGFCAQIID